MIYRNLFLGTGILLFPVFLYGGNKEQPKKNVLFIMSDDFNYWLNAIGYYPQVKTPNLNKLASEGVLFTNAYCSSPVSNPSRNALWSGLRPSTTGIDNNAAGYVREKKGLENIVTMNQYFMQNGYWVYGAGKLYHPGSMGDNPHIDMENWSERYKGGTGSIGGKFISWRNPNWGNMKYSVNAQDMNTANCDDYKMVLEVADYIKKYSQSENKDKPFFIGCGVFRPHLPWNVPMDFWKLYNTEELKMPEGTLQKKEAGMPWLVDSKAHTGVLEAGKWKEAIHAYISLMSMSDHNIGILLDALNETPYKDNTIICFMGDHGWHLGEKGQWGKATLYDEASHTSLIIYDPSAKGNGKVCKKVVSLQDLYPTLVELCGLPEKKDIEGNSLKDLLENPSDQSWDKPIVNTYSGSSFIKNNRWRYVRSNDRKKDMLFDVVNDPFECNNLINEKKYQPVIGKLNHQLDSIIAIGTKIRKDKLNGITLSNTKTKCQTVKVGNNMLSGTIDRTCVINKTFSGKVLSLNLESSDPYCNIVIYDNNGNKILDETVIGEEKVRIELPEIFSTGRYCLVVNESHGSSVEEFFII